MKLISLFVFVCFITNFVFAQDYLITFSGTGESNTVSSVLVENLTQAKSLTLNGNDVLNLKKVATAISDIEKPVIQNIRMYPNPLKGFSLLTFTLSKEGETFIELFDVAGRVLLKTNDYLPAGLHDYRLSGTGTGIYLIRVTSGNQFLTGKLISDNPLTGKPELTLIASTPANKNKPNFKSASSGIKEMQYNSGDRLKFTGISGKFKTVVVDIPEGNKTIGFTFYTCTDNDGKDYAIVGAGAQWWMAENLAYLPAVYPQETGSETLPHSYVYGYNGTGKTEAKATQNFLTYGVLYNWPSAMNGAASSNANPSGVRGLCPAGWHLPSDAEWTTLTGFLGGESDAGGKLKETGITHWQSPNTGATNESGLTSLPGGYRNSNGTFANMGMNNFWWSTTEYSGTESNRWSQSSANSYLSLWHFTKQAGFSVRCVKDNAIDPATTIFSIIGNMTSWTNDIDFTYISTSGNVSTYKIDFRSFTLEDEFRIRKNHLSDTHYGYKNITIEGEQANFFSTVKNEDIGVLSDRTYEITLKVDWSNNSLTLIMNNLTPSITTVPATSVSSTSLISGGNILNQGKTPVSERGVCWNIAGTPNIGGSKTTDGAGTGTFTSNITGLTASTKYNIRAYATNVQGTSYGNQISFTTSGQTITPPTVSTSPMTAITQTTATGGGNVTSDGGASVTAKGVCWSTSQNPTTANSKTTDGTGTGTFTSNLTGLTANTPYYVRAYATNSAGTVYGSQITLTTLPNVTTWDIYPIYNHSALGGGNIPVDGGAAITARGVCWSTKPNPTTADSKTDGTGAGSFLNTLTQLTANTFYYTRAYATNAGGTSYGSQLTFTTLPNVTTSPVTGITQTTATGGGNVEVGGGAAITTRGVCWSTSQNPTTANNKTTDGTSAGSFTSSITGLTAGTLYYVRAYATNGGGTAYGEQVQFHAKNQTGTFQDPRDNTVYDWVKIGAQTWMAENLAYLPSVSPPSAGSETSPFFYVYGYDGANVSTAKATSNYSTYGALYNWPAALTACPSGWHLPGDVEWTTLENYMIANGYNYDGTTTGNKIAKSLAANTNWKTSTAAGGPGNDLTANNTSGFSALPGGYRAYGGTFINVGSDGGCWSSSEDGSSYAWSRNLFYSYADVLQSNSDKRGGKSVRCLRDILPTVTTNPITGITQTAATSGGNVTSQGETVVTSRGVCWSTSQNPTTANSKTTDGSGAGTFTSNITGLTAGTLYYVRAYATNAGGTAYGNQESFRTGNLTGTFTDSRDNKTYNWVQIGAQVWMSQNLGYIVKVSPPDVGSEIDKFYYVYGYSGVDAKEAKSTTNYKTYGALYNWPAALTACPAGWHLPGDAEWTNLENYMIANGYNYDGTTTGNKIAKSLAATTNWSTSTVVGAIGNDLTANNKSSFSGLPGGTRTYSGAFSNVGNGGVCWSSTEDSPDYAWYRDLYYINALLLRLYNYKGNGFSVRCLRD